MGRRFRNWLHSTFVENWPVKLLSLIVAIVLWLHVLGAEDPQKTQAITVSVVPVNQPQGLETIKITPDTVELRLRGRESALEQIQTSRIRMEANLRGATVGVSEVPMRVAGVPLSLSVAPGYPATARVELDKIIERERPVHDVIRGEPARGFVIEEVTLDPAEVTVRGATSVVREVARAVVVVDVSGMNESASFDVEVEARDNRNLSVSGVHFEPKTVSVTVQVRELNVKYVPVRPVLGSPAPGYQVAGVRTDPEIVTVTSDRGLGDVSSVATLRVDISGLRGSKGYSVPLNVPEGLQVEGPASVQVTVTTQPVGGGGPEPPPQETQPEDAQDAGPDQSGGTEAGQDSDASPENQQTDPVGENDGGADEADAGDPQPEPADEEPAAEEDDNATTPTPTQGDGT